jgi:threonine aldolase
MERLADDHANARKLADGLRQIPGLRVDAPDTNLVYFHLAPGPLLAAELNSRLCSRGVLMHATGSFVLRAVTHMDVGSEDVDQAIEAVAEELK